MLQYIYSVCKLTDPSWYDSFNAEAYNTCDQISIIAIEQNRVEKCETTKKIAPAQAEGQTYSRMKSGNPIFPEAAATRLRHRDLTTPQRSAESPFKGI